MKKTTKTTRYEKVAERILKLIDNGVLKEGDKLPSIRRLSGELNVSVNTVKEAYWKLEDRNFIEAVPQSGFYVKKRPGLCPNRKSDDPLQYDPQEVSLCRIYGAFHSMGVSDLESGLGLGVAMLSPDLWPVKRLERFFRDSVQNLKNDSYNYLMPPGFLPLREQIARSVLASGLDLSPDEIVITNGCHEAIFLALMTVCKPGDTVILESPIYFNLLNLLQRLDLKIIELPASTDEGINLGTLRFALENHPVKAMFSIPNFNNPLGWVMSGEKKKALVKLLAEFGIPLIEDDIYGDIFFHERPGTCKTHDSENVLLCSSFSKTIAPGPRIGWIAPGRHYDAVVDLKSLLNISTASVNQIAIAGFLKEGGYERHLRKIRKTLREQVFALRAAVLKYFPDGTCVTNPDGGFLVWVELPGVADAEAVYHRALKKNILIAPGSLFTMKNKYSNCMRLSAGVWTQEAEKAVRDLGGMCGENLKENGDETFVAMDKAV